MNPRRSIARQLAGLSAVVLFSTALPAGASDLQIYTDSLASGWSDYSWDVTRDLSNASPSLAGTKSIAVTVTAAWGGYCVNAGTPVSTASYDQVRFWVHGGTNGGQKMWFVADFNTQQTYGFTPPANAWTLVSISLSALGNPATLTDLCWQDTSGGAQSTLFIDDVTLIQRPPVPTADLPIYTDTLAGGWQDWSWGSTRNFANTAPVHAGADSLAVTFTEAWGGLYLHPDSPIDTYWISAISFWVHGGSAGNQKLVVSADFGAHNFPFTATANAWTQVKIPLSALGNPTALTDLTWEDVTGGAQPTFYLDDIRLSVGPLPGHILTVAKASGGTGTVTSSTTGIDCGNTCSASFSEGTMVTLTATPAGDSIFAGWSGDCTGTGDCTVSINAAKSVVATFSISPGAPTNVGAVAGNSAIVVSFTAPTSTGSGAITGYLATCNPGDNKSIGTASPITVSGLTNGTTYTCTVSASNSAGTGPQSASAVATPVGQASPTVSPNALGFGVWGIGGTSNTQSVTLANTGNAILTISSITVTGDFTKATTCTSTLAGGGSCTILVSFTPTASGPRTGTLSVASSVAGTPLSVSLSGTGAATPPRLSALTLSGATLSPVFNPSVISYGTVLSNSTASVTVTASAADVTSTIQVNGTPIASGIASSPIALNFGINYITVRVTAADGITNDEYTIAITRLAPMLSAGSSHSVALNVAGSLWAWGSNYYGQLGDGTNTDNRIPKSIGSGFVAVAAGDYHTMALKTDGSLWAWGNNDYGQLGDATTVDSRSPKQIDSGYTAVAAGKSHSLALRTDGSLWGWGANNHGQLGDGTVTERHSPTRIGTGYLAVAAGLGHTLALKEDGSLWAWGLNNYGQLGDGGTKNNYDPELIGTGYKAISAAGYHSVALKVDGSLWTWGNNDYGQLGDGTTTISATPKLIGMGYTAITSGFRHNLALKTDGSLWAWGFNGQGQLGDGSRTDQLTPKQIDTGFNSVAAGTDYTVALKGDGTVWAWGVNWYGQLGDGTLAQRQTAVLVINATADGPLDLIPSAPKNIPADKILPFFSLVSSDSSVVGATATVKHTTKFNSTDVGKSGAVFVTAMVPQGSLVATQSSAATRSVSRPTALSATPPASFVLIQLTSSGWQPAVSGQLIAYASGVLGDQLAAQTILNNTDATNLSGAAFCVGYGTSAEEMAAAGRMRTVATIPDPSATGAAAPSCIVAAPPLSNSLVVAQGWNLLGNSSSGALNVASALGDGSKITTVWKWIARAAKWAFYAPSLAGQALTDYVTGKGYDVLTTINTGEGFWVNAKTAFTAPLPTGTPISSATFQGMASGWNLISIGDNKTPRAFNNALNATPPAAGDIPINISTLWAWDVLQSNWYFYAPSLDKSGGLTNYIGSKGYLDFGATKTLDPTTGFWVNKP